MLLWTRPTARDHEAEYEMNGESHKKGTLLFPDLYSQALTIVACLAHDHPYI